MGSCYTNLLKYCTRPENSNYFDSQRNIEIQRLTYSGGQFWRSASLSPQDFIEYGQQLFIEWPGALFIRSQAKPKLSFPQNLF